MAAVCTTDRAAAAPYRALLLGVLSVCGAPLTAQEAPLLELASFPRTALEIRHHEHGRERRHPVEVWVADTPERARQGLMFVSDLPDTRGMVFPLPSARIETMWMKNTYIELDMLFIRADGRVVKIIERATPLSENILSSGEPVSAVLELKGGAVQKLGLSVGDTVTWKPPAH